MLVRPIQTEKAYNEQTKRSYMFLVPKSASKQSIAEAVAAEFKVSVTDVRTTIRKGKATRFNRGKHAYPGTTYRQDKKIAYVTLKEGDKIKVFDEEPVAETANTEAKAQGSTSNVDSKSNPEAESNKKAGLFTRRRTGNRGDK